MPVRPFIKGIVMPTRALQGREGLRPIRLSRAVHVPWKALRTIEGSWGCLLEAITGRLACKALPGILEGYWGDF